MMQNTLPVGILKVDYNTALLGEDIVDSPSKAVATIASQMNGLQKEYGALLCLDVANRPICVGFLGTGTESAISLSPKEITQFALLTNAAGIILLHNHPANGQKISSLRPSSEDVIMTREISEIIRLFGINLQDHIIVNYQWDENKAKEKECTPAFYSMRSKRAYKNIFESKFSQITAYRPGNEIFTGKDVLADAIKENQNEQSVNQEANHTNGFSVPSL